MLRNAVMSRWSTKWGMDSATWRGSPRQSKASSSGIRQFDRSVANLRLARAARLEDRSGAAVSTDGGGSAAAGPAAAGDGGGSAAGGPAAGGDAGAAGVSRGRTGAAGGAGVSRGGAGASSNGSERGNTNPEEVITAGGGPSRRRAPGTAAVGATAAPTLRFSAGLAGAAGPSPPGGGGRRGAWPADRVTGADRSRAAGFAGAVSARPAGRGRGRGAGPFQPGAASVLRRRAGSRFVSGRARPSAAVAVCPVDGPGPSPAERGLAGSVRGRGRGADAAPSPPVSAEPCAGPCSANRWRMRLSSRARPRVARAAAAPSSGASGGADPSASRASIFDRTSFIAKQSSYVAATLTASSRPPVRATDVAGRGPKPQKSADTSPKSDAT